MDRVGRRVPAQRELADGDVRFGVLTTSKQSSREVHVMNLLVNPFRRKLPDDGLKAAPLSSSPAPYLPFRVKSFGLSDRGKVRRSNEDCFVIAELARTLHIHHTNLLQSKESLSRHRAHVFLVADGIGGSQAGEVASGLSVKTIEEFLLNTLHRFTNLEAREEQGVLRDLQNALFQADSRIFEESEKNPEWRGMGTTLTMAFAANWRLFVAHAGDSRCYLQSAGKLQQLTQDDTLSGELGRCGILTSADQARHPYRHVVTNFLGGTEHGVRVELHSLALHPDDVLLICSDGLTEMLPETEISAILDGESEPEAACHCLVTAANERGGKDNITAIVAHVKDYFI
jgi:protein phosphatase